VTKKKSQAKKGDPNRNYNSSMGVNNDINNVQNMDLINGMSVRDAIMHIANYRDEKERDPKAATDAKFMWIECKYS